MAPDPSTPPSLYAWAGGRDAFARWLDRFYDLVEEDEPSHLSSAGRCRPATVTT